ncbi:MAG TPA: homoserine dehydrogenase [Caulobacteraceae bacterium]|jgi:homoserine dehydrogenase|nr:homoserine dehydrogenase [Caulobacteraceae bacterium]
MSLAAVPKQTEPGLSADLSQAGTARLPDAVTDADALDLLFCYQRIANPALRRTALSCVQTLAAHEGVRDRTPKPATRRATQRPLDVLKFGSSVLRTPADAPEAVTEIYRAVRQGRRVLAVVSAFDGVTDRLIGDAQAFGCAHDNVHLPRYVALGEETSAALLALACDRAGLTVAALSPAEIGILAEGDRETAKPTGLDAAVIERAFETNDVVVVPGFTARDRDGNVVLLGRGGSDLTAVFLGAELGADRVRLVKDVDGVYDRDPKSNHEALRFAALTWSAARDVAGKLVQARALDMAEDRGVAIEIAALGREDATAIGPNGQPPVSAPSVKRAASRAPLRVAVAGCGVVGGGIVDRLRRRADAFEITGVLVRDPMKLRDIDAAGLMVTEPEALLEWEPEVVVDVLSCAKTGAWLSQAALDAGVSVVSANKQAVISAHARLAAAAQRTGARLYCSASVGGGAPLIETVRAARKSGPIARLDGVLNGTVNFLLGRLAAGERFADALKAAQAAGLAEEDPSADLDGRDAAAKLRILALEAFDELVGAVDVDRAVLDDKVIQCAASQPLKQVSRLSWENGRLKAQVVFAPDPQFAGLDADRNRLRVVGMDGRVFTAQGRGAGRWPTTESVLSDLLDFRAARAS